MRQLACWARSLPWTARFIIILSHVILVWLAIFFGRELFKSDIILPGYLFYSFAALYLLAVITYPNKKKRHVDAGYFFKQKSRDLLLAAATVGMVTCLTNKPDRQLNIASLQSLHAAVIKPQKEKPTAKEILESLKYRDKSSLTRQEKKILRKEFKIQLKNYVVATVKGDKQAKANAGLVILAVVVAIGLLILVGALACELSCNGSEGAAILVGVLGGAAVIVGLILVLRAIKKGKPKPEPATPET